MRCPVRHRHPELLLDFCARTLSSETAAILLEHLIHCSECRAFAESQQMVWSALDCWQPPRVSDDFDRRLYRRMRSAAPPRPLQMIAGLSLSWKPALTIALAGGAMAILLMTAGVASHPAIPPIRASGLADCLDAEQIDRAVQDLDMLRQFSTPAAKPSL